MPNNLYTIRIQSSTLSNEPKFGETYEIGPGGQSVVQMADGIIIPYSLHFGLPYPLEIGRKLLGIIQYFRNLLYPFKIRRQSVREYTVFQLQVYDNLKFER